MTNHIEIVSKYKDSYWSIVSSVTDDSEEDFPRDIFLWTLKDDGSLDEFQAIGAVDQVSRYPLYNPSRTNNFGVHLVRHNVSDTKVDSESDKDKVIEVLKSAFDTLVAGYDTVSTPVTIIYP